MSRKKPRHVQSWLGGLTLVLASACAEIAPPDDATVSAEDPGAPGALGKADGVGRIGPAERSAPTPPPAGCAVPTIRQCRSKAFLATRCGRAQAQTNSVCHSLLGADFRTQLRALPTRSSVTPSTVVTARGSESREVEATEVDYVADDQSGFHQEGRDGTYTGQIFRAQVAARVDDDVMLPVGGASGETYSVAGRARDEMEAQRDAWEANGNQVASCEEYVYEKYYDYEQFEDAIVGANDDYLAVFHAIYDADLDDGEINGRDGTAVRAITLPAGNFRKNSFLVPFDRVVVPQALTAGPLGPTVPVYAFPNEALNEIRASGTHRETWAWHAQMAEALAEHPVELLYELRDRQAEYRELREDHQRLVRRIAEIDAHPDEARAECNRNTQIENALAGVHIGGGGGNFFQQFPACEPVTQMRAAFDQLFAVDTAMGEALEEAARHGCVDHDDVSPCDWDPSGPAKRVLGQLTAEREADYQRCLGYTGNDFRYLRDPRPLFDSWRPAGALQDYVDSPREVETFYTHLDQWFDHMNFPIDTSKEPKLSSSASDASDEGDDDFAVRWAFSAGWELQNLGAETPLCEADLVTWADLEIDAEAFGMDLNGDEALFEARFSAATGQANVASVGRVDAGARMAVLVNGDEVFVPLDERDLTFQLTETAEVKAGAFVGRPDDERIELASPTFYIAGIPVTVSAGIAGRAGVTFDLRGGEDRNCAAQRFAVDVTADVTPSARLEGYLSVAVDLLFVEVGVRGYLTLIDAALPFHAGLGIETPQPGAGWSGGVPSTMDLFAESSLRLRLSTLGGRVVLYADFGIFGDAELDLFRWDGIVLPETSIFDVEYSIPVPAVVLFMARN